jgi:hypothetical protein
MALLVEKGGMRPRRATGGDEGRQWRETRQRRPQRDAARRTQRQDANSRRSTASSSLRAVDAVIRMQNASWSLKP